jgi:ATP-binding cassette subfamily B protein
MSTSLATTAMQALLKHSDQFFANRKVGSLAGDVTSFSRSIIGFLDTVYLAASGIIINFAASLIIIGIMSPILLLPLGLLTIFLCTRTIAAVAKRGPFRHKRKVLMSKLTGTTADILGNSQVVRYFTGSSRELQTIINERQKIESIASEEINIIEHESLIRQVTLFGFQIITIALSIYLYTNNLVSIAALVFAITYMSRLTSSLFDLSPLIRNIEQAFLDASAITEILEETAEVTDRPKATALRVTKGAVELHAIDFSYDPTSKDHAIHHVSLNIQPGQHIGLAGHSGGGKTTLSKLLLRFADVTGGSILIDGQDIREITQESLRAAIAYVPQEAYLFHRSLRENIAYGKPDATDAEIWEAIRQANAEEFTRKLPDGLDTIVGERGVKLSGGQRQRIAIARAILKDAPILILDEATSALDSESEKLIQDALEKLMKGRTSIVIAHRLSTIAKLDRIIVLDKGSVIEDGTHNELLAKNGTYAKLWSHQSGGFIEE